MEVSSPSQEGESRAAVHVEIEGWAPLVAISGGLGLLLSVYLQSSSPVFRVRTTEPDRIWSVNLQVDLDSRTYDFLKDVENSHRPKPGFPNDHSSFWLCIDIQNEAAAFDGTSASDPAPGGGPEVFSIPNEIFCTVQDSTVFLSSVPKITKQESPGGEIFLSQLAYVTSQLLVVTTSIRDVDWICESDRRNLRGWNRDLPSTIISTVHDIIGQRAFESPGSQAVHSREGGLTYGELDSLSSHLCSILLEAEVQPGECIPLCFEKSLWAVVAMLAVLKSGCSFLLMDVSHPTSRLQQLLSEVKATTLLSSFAQKERAISLVPKVVVVSNQSCQTPLKQKQHKIEVSPSAVAAIVFTSGTTGTPKGIALDHAAITSSLIPLAKSSGINKETRFFDFSSYAFDAAYGEILMTLLVGGCLCIPSEEDRLSSLAESICYLNANTALLTPTVLRFLSPPDVPSLKTVLSGGERVTDDIVETWAVKVNLIIAYGPAECTVACITKKCQPTERVDSRIGVPVNCRAWITLVDNPMRLAPVGVIGELMIEGPGVARHYTNNHQATAASFLESPPWAHDLGLCGTKVGRCYRTGDLARLTDDGELVFVGRRDRQVKIRGQRIELEEVESRLTQCLRRPDTQIFVDVLDLPGGRGSGTMVAFIYWPHHQGRRGGESSHHNGDTAEEIALEVEELRARLSAVLPSYMTPVLWVPLGEVPMTLSGKLDRHMLLRLGNEYHARSRVLDEHDGDSGMESVLGGIWQEILQLTAGGLPADAHFFRLGGDSIRAMELVTSLRKAGYILTMERIFRNPTLCGMAEAMQAVSAHNGSGPIPAPTPSLPIRDVMSELWPRLGEPCCRREEAEDIICCTTLQEALFSLSLALPSLYTGQFVFVLSSVVEVQRLKTAFESALRTFPMLRTTLVPCSSGFMQVVRRYQPVEWTEVKQELQSYLAADRVLGFLPGQPLARHCLLEEPSSGKTYLVWMLHHAIYDGWSLESVVGYIRDEYYQRTRTTQLPRSFREFVGFCEDLNKDESRIFWKEQLRDAPTPSFPELPKSRRVPRDDSCLRYKMTIPAGAILETTTTIMARAAWALVISEYEGSDDVVFGNTLHGRNSLPAELQQVVGPTLTTLPVRVRIARNCTISNFLNGLKEQFSTMISHEQFGLSRIIAIDKDVKDAASFRTLLVVQGTVSEAVDDKQIEMKEVSRTLHEYPLVITLEPREMGIDINATFDSNILSAPHVQRILEQFEQAFYKLCTMPSDTKVGELDLASKAEKSAMFRWNARFHRAFEVCVHEMIQEQVKRSPASPAVYSRHGSVDYATLERLSDILATYMIKLGVEPGSVVGVLFEKSQWGSVAILAAIKAGAAFAPLSPSHPKARLEEITRQAGIKIVLCSFLQTRRFPNPVWQAVVVDHTTIRSFQTTKVRVGVVTPDSPLYVLSTSGTTGTPKLFTVLHKSFATGAIARAPLIKRGSDSRVLQFAPSVFDPSVEDILTTFMFGGCVCVPSEEDIFGDLTGFMQLARVNFANITPSVAYTLDPQRLPDLKVLLLSGEAPEQALIAKWDNRVQLMNGYGPSECSVKCSINCHLSRHDPRNIGHAVGSGLWVVRPSNPDCLVPLGAIGELLIESPNLANGYINRQAETALRFIASPKWLRDFRNHHEAVVYKTGDLVRQLEDGSVVYVGRADSQLKVNGQRFEAEEVQQRILETLHDEKLQVVVDITKFRDQNSDILVAFIAESREYGAGALDPDDAIQNRLDDMKQHITRQLGNILPKYMIPTVLVAVSNIPVTSNGKVDRRKLRSFTQRLSLRPQLDQSAGYLVQPPTTETEKLLHALWQEQLEIDGEQFGSNSHFFELGGSSLSAIKLSAAVRALGHTLPVSTIFERPIMSDMAEKMEFSREVNTLTLPRFSLLEYIDCNVEELEDGLATYNIEKQTIEDAYPSTRQQRINMDEEKSSAGSVTFQHIVPLPADIDLARLETALRRVVQANPFLRTRLISLPSKLVQVILADDFICRRFEDMRMVLSDDRSVSWGLGQPLSRFSIVDEGTSKTRYLAWSINHAMFDGWCRRLLFEDLDYTYHHNELPSARPKYAKFIKHVYELDTVGALSKFMWDLGHRPYHNYFSLDGKRTPCITRFLTLPLAFPATLPTGLSYATVLVTAWALASARVEEHNHLLFNLLLSGRDVNIAGIDRLMGPTSSRAPVCISIDEESTIREQVESVQKRLRDAAHLQHAINLGDELHNLLASAPIVVVHPAEDYVDAPTKHLGLLRSRVKLVNSTANPMFMNLILWTGNRGVDFFAEIDPAFVSEHRAMQYFGYLAHAIKRLFAAGGMDLKVKDIDWGVCVPGSRLPIKISETGPERI